jgi:hypothetical protein
MLSALWKLLLLTPVLLSGFSRPVAAQPAESVTAKMLANPAATSVDSDVPAIDASQQPVDFASEPSSSDSAAPVVDSSLEQILEYSSEGESMDQVTSISQLSDVEPTDWAFQAL